MKQKAFIFLFLLVFLSINLPAQVVLLDSLSRQAYSDIMSLKFTSANQLLIKEQERFPQNVFVDYLQNNMGFLKSFISENENIFNEADAGYDQRYKRIAQLPENNPYRNYLLANMNLQWAFARLKFKQYFSAAIEINRAYRLLTSNTHSFPDFVPDDLSLGVLHVIIGMVPAQYNWILRLISMEGNVEQGKNEIYTILQKSLQYPEYKYLKPEALFYLGFIELNLSPDQKHMNQLMTYLDQMSHDNLLMAFLKLDILMRHGKNEQALVFLKSLDRKKGFYPFYYLDYLEGECYLRKLKPEAQEQYLYFLHHFKGVNYRKDAWRKCAWTALIKGDTLKYFQFLDSLKSDGNTDVDGDKSAQAEAERKVLPNIPLLQSRLLFDGGYFQQAKQILQKMDTTALKADDKLEWLYRFGRIEHALKQWTQAKYFYKKSIISGKGSPRYFAANAALNMGRIYEQEDSLEQAKTYYNLCLTLDFQEYKNSIQGKAKEALSRMQTK